MPGNAGYDTLKKENTPPEVRFKTRAKYPRKLLVWLAISANRRAIAKQDTVISAHQMVAVKTRLCKAADTSLRNLL